MYEIIYADPPWDYRGSTQRGTGAINHYPTMKLSQLKQIHIPKADNCLLFMWSTSPHLNQALELISAWDFTYSTIGFVWDKQKPIAGSYTMSQVEVCLIARYGKIPQPRGARNIKQFVSEPRGLHSSKPSEVRTRIQKMFPSQIKLELFARQPTDGWDVFGNDEKVLPYSIELNTNETNQTTNIHPR